MSLKLIFIGQESKVFKYNGKQYRPYYIFSEKFEPIDIKPYLKKSDVVDFNYSKFLESSIRAGNKKSTCLYACDDKKVYLPMAETTMAEFDMELFVKKNKLVSEQVESSPIPPEYIILTKDKDIINMMSDRGYKILNYENQAAIVAVSPLPKIKKYVQEYKIRNPKTDIKEDSKIITKTGIEKVLTINLYSKEHKITRPIKAKSVTSRIQNKIYTTLKIGSLTFYYEVWFTDNGEVDFSPKHKSFELFVWGN